MGVLDDMVGLAPATGRAGSRRSSPYPWPADTGTIGTQTALPPANTIPPIGLFPATSGGATDFESAWGRKLLADEQDAGTHEVEGADLGDRPPLERGWGLSLEDLEHAWYVTDGSVQQFVNSIVGEGANEYLARTYSWIHGADTYEDELRRLNDRDRAFDEQYPDVINGFARTFANSVPLIGALPDKAAALTYAASEGFRDGAYSEELQRQRDLARAYQERYPWLSHLGGSLGEVLGSLAVGRVAPGTLSLGLGGAMAPVVDIMATGGLAAGLDSFARGFGNATGDVWDLVEGGLENLPRDVFNGATLGPMFDQIGGWTIDRLGLEDVSDGLLGKVAGQAIWKLFS